MKKTIISLFITICLLASLCSVYATNEDNEYQYDGLNIRFDSVQFLNNIGIIKGDENGNLQPEKKLTRAEFTALLLRMLGYEIPGSSAESNFIDVSSDAWYSKDIAFATELGLIDGYGDGNFGPNDPVTFEQACKIIVSAYGYSAIAERDGGFPKGYVSIANSIGISKGVTISNSLSRRDISDMFVNCLDAEFFTETFRSKLVDYFELKKYTGVVESVYGATINPFYNVGSDSIVISGKMYKTDMLNIQKYIGLSVYYYTKMEGSVEKVVYIWSNNNELLMIDADDIYPSTTATQIVYEGKSGGTRRVSVNATAVIVRNGEVVSVGAAIASILQPKMGSLTLLDNNGDKKYDVVFVEEYRNIVFSNYTEEVIYDKLGNSVDISKCDNLEVYRNGLLISLNDINKNEIVSVIENSTGTYIICYVSNVSINGKIMSYYGDEYEFEVDGDNGVRTYKMSEEYKNYYISGSTKIDKLSPGDEAVIYLDYRNKIAMTEKSHDKVAELKYGYLLDCSERQGGSFVKIKVLTENNHIESFESTTERIKFGHTDGVSGQYLVDRAYANDIVSIMQNASGTAIKQLLQYSLNEDRNITGIYLKAPAGNDDYISQDVSTSSSYYTNNTLNKQFYTDGATKAFKIPYEGKYERYLASGNINQFASNNSSISVELYDIKDFHVGAIVLTDDVTLYESTTAGKEVVIDKVNSPILYVDGIKTVANEDDEVYTVISGYQNKEYVEVLVSNSLASQPSVMKQIFKGAIIQYEVNYPDQERALTVDDDKVMIMFTTLFDCNKKNTNLYQNWNYSDVFNQRAMITTTYAEVTDVSDDAFFAKFNRSGNGEVTTPFIIREGTFVMGYSTMDKKFSKKTRYDLAPGQKVFIRERYNNVREVVIID